MNHRNDPAIPALSIAWLVLALVAGCGSPAPAPAPPAAPLNSERIEQRFGSFGIEVLYQDAALRVSNLYSLERGRRVCRTFALVRFAPVPPQLEREHELIEDGGSLGAVMQANGWAVHKRHLYLGEVALEPRFVELVRLMAGIAAPALAVHVYRLSVSREARSLDYATVLEVHHPDYLDLARLSAAYGVAPERHATLTPPVVALIETARRLWSGYRPREDRRLPGYHAPPGVQVLDL